MVCHTTPYYVDYFSSLHSVMQYVILHKSCNLLHSYYGVLLVLLLLGSKYFTTYFYPPYQYFVYHVLHMKK